MLVEPSVAAKPLQVLSRRRARDVVVQAVFGVGNRQAEQRVLQRRGQSLGITLCSGELFAQVVSRVCELEPSPPLGGFEDMRVDAELDPWRRVPGRLVLAPLDLLQDRVVLARVGDIFKQMREHVLAMKELWTKEEASYNGEFVKFDRVWSWPKPAQRPHPPVILGGETDHTLRRVIEYCDGWFPRPRGGFDVVKGVGHLHQMAEKAGRDPKTITTIVFGAANDAKALESYDKAGIQSALLAIPDESRDEILRYLDKIAPLAKLPLAA